MRITKIHKYGYIEITEDVDDKLFFISDTHFDHKNIIHLSRRPFKDVDEMNNTMIENWNKVVSDDSLVIIVGDFCWSGDANRWRKLLTKLKGQKILIKGNHDNYKVLSKIDDCFITIRDRLELRVNGFRMLLDHYPMVNWSGCWHGVYSVYGHIHEKDFPNAKPTQYNVSVERNEYKPISFYELCSIFTKQTKEDTGNLWFKDIKK